jgi:hypothetical protein
MDRVIGGGKVVERVVKACSNRGDLILDLMAGIVSACLAVASLGR